jgi:hypothetical protein
MSEESYVSQSFRKNTSIVWQIGHHSQRSQVISILRLTIRRILFREWVIHNPFGINGISLLGDIDGLGCSQMIYNAHPDVISSYAARLEIYAARLGIEEEGSYDGREYFDHNSCWNWMRDTFYNALGDDWVMNPLWRTETAIVLAKTIHNTRDLSLLPILSDALLDAGCDDERLIRHCQEDTERTTIADWVLWNLQEQE